MFSTVKFVLRLNYLSEHPDFLLELTWKQVTICHEDHSYVVDHDDQQNEHVNVNMV